MTYLAEVKGKKDEDVVLEEKADGPVFDQTPVRVSCPACASSVITFIEHESSWVTYAACLGLVLVLGWAAILVVPIVYPLFKDVVHHCPRCLSVLATRSRVALPSFKQEVMSFRFGSCVVVLARKYVLMLLALSAVIGTIHYARTSVGPPAGLDALERGPVVPLGWTDYVRDCGLKSYLGNPIHVSMAFKEKYKNRTFAWEGSVYRVEDGLSFLWFHERGALFVRMQQPQLPRSRAGPDLALLFDSRTPAGIEAGKLRKGSNVSFTATMVEVGKRGMPHVMLLWELGTVGALSPPPSSTESPAPGGVV